MRSILPTFCLLVLFLPAAGRADSTAAMALGTQSNAPHYMALQSAQAPIRLASGNGARFLSLPSRDTGIKPMPLERQRYFKLPVRASDDAPAPNRPRPEASDAETSSAKTAAALAPVALPVPSTENDATMHATVAAQAHISQTGQQLADPIDLILATAAKRAGASSRN